MADSKTGNDFKELINLDQQWCYEMLPWNNYNRSIRNVEYYFFGVKTDEL